MTAAEMNHDTNQTRSIVAATVFVGVSTMFLNVSPIITGVMADTFGFSTAQLGQLMGLPLFGSAATCISQPFWIRRIRNWRHVLLGFSVLTTIAYLSAALLSTYIGFVVCFTLLGLAVGGLYGISMTLIGDSNNPDRGFGGAQLAQSFVGLPLIVAIPAIIEPTFGFGGVMITMAAYPFLCLFAAQFIPVNGFREGPASAQVQANSSGVMTFGLAPILAIISVTLFLQGFTGLYVFLERIGDEGGLSGVFIGTVLAVSGICGSVATLIPIYFGNRFGRVLPAGVGSLLFVLGLWLLGIGEKVPFVVGNLFVGIAYAIAAPYLFAQLAASDKDGTFTAALPAILLVASGVGPVVAGWFYTDSFDAILIFGAVSIVAAQVFVYWSRKTETG